MLRFDLQWFNEHRCQWCGKKCKPIYDRVCKDCKHAWWQHTLLLDGHCSGKRVLETAQGQPLVDCNCQTKGDLVKNPTQFIKRLLGYGILQSGFFCRKECAVNWAHHVLRNRPDRPLPSR